MAAQRTPQRAWAPQHSTTVTPFYTPPPEFKCKLVVAPHKHGFSPKIHTIPARKVVDSWSSSTSEPVEASRCQGSIYSKQPSSKSRKNVNDIYRAFKVVLVLSAIAFWVFGVGAGPVIKCAAGESCKEAKASVIRLILDRARSTITGTVGNQLHPDPLRASGGETVSAPLQTDFAKNPFERIRDWSTIVAYMCGTVLIIAFAIETLIWELSAFIHIVIRAPMTMLQFVIRPFVKRKH